MTRGIIFDIKEMAVHDGPGIRTTVFLKGCPLRCRWCHNPEGLSFERQLMYKDARCIGCGQCRRECSHELCRGLGRCILACPENCLEIAGRELTAEELARELLPSAEILGGMFGGFTFSGGEPLAQPDFLLETAQALQGHHLCMETSAHAPQAVFRRVLERMDYVIMDIKLADSRLHEQYTGADNRAILENYRILRESGKPHLIRTPLIAGITDTRENLEAIAQIIGDSPWEQLPYNALAGAKYRMLGMQYEL